MAGLPASASRSHLATEIVQSIMRCRLREDASASVCVFIPLGQNTELLTEILRELPGATVSVPLSRDELRRLFGEARYDAVSANDCDRHDEDAAMSDVDDVDDVDDAA